MKEQYVKLTVVEFIKHDNPFNGKNLIDHWQ